MHETMAEPDPLPLDVRYLVETACRLVEMPTVVDPGFDTLMEPDHPKLVEYVQHLLRPELVRLGCYRLTDAGRNDLVVEHGQGFSGRVLLIQNYTVTQHHHDMEAPLVGRVGTGRRFGIDGPVLFGQGVSQNKAHQAVMLTVLRALIASDRPVRGRLYWAINNEGRSSHGSSDRILDALPETPGFCLLQFGTGLRISLGNRGRVDVDVRIEGKVAHSSTPEDGASAIEGAHLAIERLRALRWPDTHPRLGRRQAVVYKIRYSPQVPHTLPAVAELTVDRRLLPGDDPAAAAEEVRQAIGTLAPYRVEVREGVSMMPALVDPDDEGVQVLQRANRAVRGAEAETFYGRGTFDAGGPASRGIPTVMFGATGGVWPAGTDFVSIEDVVTESRVLAAFILGYLG